MKALIGLMCLAMSTISFMVYADDDKDDTQACLNGVACTNSGKCTTCCKHSDGKLVCTTPGKIDSHYCAEGEKNLIYCL